MHKNNLQSFCAYISDCYNSEKNLGQFREYYLEAVAKDTVGGISDMTLVANWLRTCNFDNIMNLIVMNNDAIFDIHIGVPFQAEDDLYKFRYGYKLINWRNNIPYCYSYKYKKDIRFHLLHFQGPAKYLMARFYTGNTFPRKLRLDIKFFFANIAAFWYKTLKIRYHFAWLFDIILKFKAK